MLTSHYTIASLSRSIVSSNKINTTHVDQSNDVSSFRNEVFDGDMNEDAFDSDSSTPSLLFYCFFDLMILGVWIEYLLSLDY